MYESICTYYWIDPITWWLDLGSSEKAAWIQAIGSILAIAGSFYLATIHQRDRQKERDETHRKIVMSAAANLNAALSYQSAIFDFAPQGDGAISHEMDFDQAVNFIKLQTQVKDALKMVVDKSHYFSADLCEEIVKLSLAASAYDRIISQRAMIASHNDPDKFFSEVNAIASTMSDQIQRLRSNLSPYLPANESITRKA